jgi:ParB family chromosome partitioning protein
MTITVQLLPITSVAVPSHVRTQNGYDKESIGQLAASINQHGLLQPIVVRPATDDDKPAEWVIVAGRRRIAACKLAGMTEVPALVTQTDEAKAYELEIAENIQREQMTLADTARAVRTLMTIYDNAKKVGEVLNKSAAWVSKHLAVTSSKCPAAVLDLMDRGIVTDLETLILLKQVAEMPTSNIAAAQTMTRMLRIAHEGNMNRQIARDALAKLKAPASPAPITPTVAKLTTTRTVAPEGTFTGNPPMTADPEKEFTVILPIDLLALVEMKGGTDWIIGIIKANSES